MASWHVCDRDSQSTFWIFPRIPIVFCSKWRKTLKESEASVYWISSINVLLSNPRNSPKVPHAVANDRLVRMWLRWLLLCSLASARCCCCCCCCVTKSCITLMWMPLQMSILFVLLVVIVKIGQWGEWTREHNVDSPFQCLLLHFLLLLLLLLYLLL